MEDDFPVMVRSFRTRDYFREFDYFKNVENIKTAIDGESDEATDSTYDSENQINLKRMIHGLTVDQDTVTKKRIEYVEWHGKINKRELYNYEGKPIEGPDGQPLTTKYEKVWAIVGMASNGVLVRCEETPFDIGKPNIVVGSIQVEEDEIIGTSICDKIYATQQGLDVLIGILLENFKQSVNAGHVINTAELSNGGQVTVNKQGFVIETTGDVNKVHKRIEQPRVAPDIYTFIDMFKQFGKGSSGIKDIITGRGDANTETLGEANIIANQAQLRMKDYLRCFEDTFIQPMYEMRNQINMQFLDEDYLYMVVGEAVQKWRTATPYQIRANVDFICESSAREANKTVLTQQLLQFAELAPLIQSMGFPVRLDKIFGKLAEQGFSWDRKTVEEIIPSLKFERDGADINGMLMELMKATLGTSIDQAGGQPDPNQLPGGGNSPQSTSESEAIAAVNKKGQPTTRS